MLVSTKKGPTVFGVSVGDPRVAPEPIKQYLTESCAVDLEVAHKAGIRWGRGGDLSKDAPFKDVAAERDYFKIPYCTPELKYDGYFVLLRPYDKEVDGETSLSASKRAPAAEDRKWRNRVFIPKNFIRGKRLYIHERPLTAVVFNAHTYSSVGTAGAGHIQDTKFGNGAIDEYLRSLLHEPQLEEVVFTIDSDYATNARVSRDVRHAAGLIRQERPSLRVGVAYPRSWKHHNAKVGIDDAITKYGILYVYEQCLQNPEWLFEAPQTPVAPPMSLKDLGTLESKPVTYAVTGTLPIGAYLLIGAPKSGKTILAQNLTYEFSVGGFFLNHKVLTPGEVLYISVDDPNRDRFVRRMKELGPLSDKIHAAFEWPSGDAGTEHLRRYLSEHPDVKLVIVDSYIAFRTGRNSSKRNFDIQEADYKDLKALQELSTESSVLIVVIAHTRKRKSVNSVPESPAEEVGQTQMVNAAVDGTISLFRVSTQISGEGTKLGMVFIQARDLEEEWSYGIELRDMRWKVVGDVQYVVSSHQRMEILQAMSTDRDKVWTAEEIHTLVGGNRSVQTIRNLMSKMVKANALVSMAGGEGGGGGYRLAPARKEGKY